MICHYSLNPVLYSGSLVCAKYSLVVPGPHPGSPVMVSCHVSLAPVGCDNVSDFPRDLGSFEEYRADILEDAARRGFV